MPRDALVDCNLFSGVDILILSWMNDRLLNEDVDAKLYGKAIVPICIERQKMHFGPSFRDAYSVMQYAWQILKPGIYSNQSDIKGIIKQYTGTYYQVDRNYRYFYTYYDALENNAPYEKLRSLVELVYTNDYLNPMIVDFATALSAVDGRSDILMQHGFYSTKVRYSRDRVVVIISDACGTR